MRLTKSALILYRAAFAEQARVDVMQQLKDIKSIVAQEGIGTGRRYRVMDSTGFRAWLAFDDNRITRTHMAAWTSRYFAAFVVRRLCLLLESCVEFVQNAASEGDAGG